MRQFPQWQALFWRVYVRFILLGRRLQQLRNQSQEGRNIRNLVLQTALLGVTNGGILSFIPVFLARSGASSLEVSLLTSLPAMLSVFLAIPAGVYVGRQRNLVRTGTRYFLPIYFTYLVVALLPFLALIGPWADRAIIWGAVIFWGLSAVFNVVAITAWMAAIAQAIPPRRRPAINGLRLSLLGLISAASVAGFGRVLDILPFPENYQLVFAISSVASLISLFFFSRVRLEEAVSANGPEPEKKTPLQRLKGFIANFIENKNFLRFSASAFVYRWGLFTPIALYSIYWVNHLDATDTMIGLRSTIEQLTMAAAFYFWGRVATAKGFRLVLIISSAGYALYPILTGVVSTMAWLLPVSVVAGFFVGGINISFFEAFLKSCPDDKRPTFIAMNNFLANIAAFSAPLVGAAVSDIFGIQIAFFLGGGLLLIGMVLFFLLLKG